jgi:protein-disulfide isomerase
MRYRVLGAATLLVVAGCSPSSAQQRLQGPGDVVATVGSVKITLAELDERAMQAPTSSFPQLRLSQAVYEARRSALDTMVGDLLIDQEAKARGIDRSALIEQEITAKAPAVTEADVAAWYQANQARVQGATLDQVRGPIRALLTQDAAQTAREHFVDTLRTKTSVRVSLEPPRLKVETANRPARGPADAPIEMIEFSDFECPYCLRANPTVNQVLSTYGDKIRFTYRHFPLGFHPDARPAAEAAQCANEQGKFWPYHDKLFANPGHLSPADLRQTAETIGLDMARFGQCVDTHKYKADVDADVAAGEAVGVDGTPAFFINGRMVSGAQPFELFKRVIDEELDAKHAR